jgi:RNA polymerase sigma-70 factor (ECF subfamily)
MADDPEAPELPDAPELADAATSIWKRFHLAFEDLRPELYRYCRHLTRSPWDAEDLAQDTMARAFVTLSTQAGQTITHPRSWLFRVASNLWIDRARRAKPPAEPLDDVSVAPADPRATREAAGTLIARLSPQERVAVVLKDAFDLSLEDIAAAIDTTVGAVKAALHRGRGKLRAPEPELTRVPAPAALHEFCAAFNAGDLPRLTQLLLDTALIELPGVAVDLDVAASCKPAWGILYHTLFLPISAGVPARFLADYVPTPPRAELRLHHGEPIALIWHAHTTGEAVRAFARFELNDLGQITRLREHYYSPEALAEIAGELGVVFRSNGYGHD